MGKIEEKFEILRNKPSDINEHFDTLRRYASDSETICEMGVRAIISTWALLAGKPKKLISLDFQDPQIFGANIEEVYEACQEYGIEFQFQLANTLEYNLEPCDLLLIDTWHDFLQLKMELYRHHSKVKKFIILHDTNSFGFRNEDFYELYDQGRPESNLPKGLVPAVDEFINNNPEWFIYERFAHNNGVTVLKRKN